METIKVKCCKCNEVYDLKESIGKLPCTYSEHIGVEAKKLLLTYSVCPHCGNIHLSQLDDEVTQVIVKELHRLIKKKILFESKGRKLKRKDSRRVLELDSELNVLRIYLKKTYNNKVLKHNMQNKLINNKFVFKYSEPRIVKEKENE